MMKAGTAMGRLWRAAGMALALAAWPAGATADLAGTAWGSDPARNCFVLGLELGTNGRADIAVSTLDVLQGKWKLNGATLNATFVLDAQHPPLELKAKVSGDRMQATYTWNEGTDGGPDREDCEFRKVTG